MRQLESLASNPFVTCDAVVTEACFHLRHRSQRRRLQALIQELNVDPLPAIVDADFWSDAFAWLHEYSEHEPAWAVACLAVLSGRDRQLRIWTYDREFRTTWRRPTGTPIPMAV